MNRQAYDATIIGAGFAGSILAWILSQSGMRVALIDAATHPRFAIGESSTPIADIILRRLAASYQLPAFAALASWGEWQKHFPMLSCGRKRGFSYYQHVIGEEFAEPQLGDRSLLIAASPTDALSDTHWYRPEVDHFFFQQAIGSGTNDFSGYRVVGIRLPTSSQPMFDVNCSSRDHNISLQSPWLIDASGAASVASRLLDATNRTSTLSTSTCTTYAHYENVGSWTTQLRRAGHDLSHDPFDADDAAQHHLLQHGWAWMLRFNNGITSVGQTTPMDYANVTPELTSYPSLKAILREARQVAPSAGPIRTGRLQQLFSPVLHKRLLLMPTAALTLDPLHSTGIAHALAGVDRIAGILLTESCAEQQQAVERYEDVFEDETRLLDLLVSTAYATMGDFSRFATACSLFIAGAICCEERYQRGDSPSHLWGADDSEFVRFAREACSQLQSSHANAETNIRVGLRPWNQAGLMNPDAQNRYAYTATKGSDIGQRDPASNRRP